MFYACEGVAVLHPRTRQARGAALRAASPRSGRGVPRSPACAAARPGARGGPRRAAVGVPDYSSPLAASRAPQLPEVTPPEASFGGGCGGEGDLPPSGFGGGGGGGDDAGAPRLPPLLLAAALSLAATAAAARGFGGRGCPEPAAVAASATDALAGAAARAAGRQLRAAHAAAAATAHAAVVATPERFGSRLFARELAREAADREAATRNPFAQRWPAAEEMTWPEAPPEPALAAPSHHEDEADEEGELLRLSVPPAVARAATAAAEWARGAVRGRRLPVDAAEVARRADALARAAARNARIATGVTARTLRVTGFAADAATGTARAEIGGRCVIGDTPCVITLSAPAPGVVPRLGAPASDGDAAAAAADDDSSRGVLLTLRGGGYSGVLRLGGGLVALAAPSVSLREGLTLRPEWRGGLLPALHMTWLPLPRELPPVLAAGASAVRATLDAGRGGACVAATHARRAPAGAVSAGAAHAARLTLRAGVGALSGAAAEGVYKLKLPREGLTLGAAVDTGGRRPAPAVAFLKLRHAASGGVLRLTSGLAARVLAAELALPDAVVNHWAAAGGAAEERGRWHAQLMWRDGRVAAATLTRRVAY